MKTSPKAAAEKPRINSARLRLAVALSVLAVAAVGYFSLAGIGNLCAGGLGDLVLLCPLGALAAMIAQHTIIPQAVVSLCLAAVALLLVGRAFCAWACPTTLLERLLPARRKKPTGGLGPAGAKGPLATADGAVSGKAPTPAASGAQHPGACASCASCAQGCGKAKGVKLDSRHAILGAALASTLVFGFPVFCLVCPVGLTFAGVLLVMRLFAFGEVTWALVAIPVVLAIELALLPRWCQNICPLGALQSLVAAGNRTFVPVVNRGKCLKTTKQIPCDACVAACPEGINLHDIAAGRTTLADCTKCRACADACPARAISFPLLAPKKPARETLEAPDLDEGAETVS